MGIRSKQIYYASAIAIAVVLTLCILFKGRDTGGAPPSSTRAAASENAILQLGIRSAAPVTEGLTTQDSIVTAPSVGTPSQPYSNTSQHDIGSDQRLPYESDSSSPIDGTEVIGRPFRLSESVRRFCAGRQVGAVDCPELMDFLARFAEEPRDEAWATSIEQRIRLVVAESARSDATLRQVECRTNKCVLEIEAPEEFVLTEFDSDPTLKHELDKWIGDLGFEKENGRTVVVTLATFDRRRRILRDLP